MKYNTIYLLILALITFGCEPANTGKHLKIDDFIDALSEANLNVGKKNEKWSQMLMATDGCSFSVNGQNIEVYEFDTEIQSGRDAIEKWEREGFMGQTVIVNHNLMIFRENEHENWESILSVFESL